MKKADKKKREWLVTAAVILAILFAAVSWNLYQEKKLAAAEAQLWREQAGTSQKEGKAGYGQVQNTIEYKGKTYRRNTYVKAILCMGIDRREPLTEMKTAGAGGQSDGIFLVAQDTARNRVQVLAIPRDTMTPIPLTDLSGNILGYDTQHLTLAYAYGDGREKSCQFMCRAVTELLDGLQIDGYMAVSMGALKPLNDAVDGVTVTIDDPELEKRDPAFKPGTSVTLMGDQAEAFLRYRDTGKSQSAVARLERQKGYIAGYAEAVKKKASREEGVALKLLETAAPYMVTNLSKDQYLVPYLMSSHPGSTMKEAVELAEYLRDLGYMPEQVQDFYPTPSTISTCMYYTGYDCRTMEKVYVPVNPHEKAMQRALIQYRDPKNYDLVTEALRIAGRTDLIGYDKKCLVRPGGTKDYRSKNSSGGSKGGKGTNSRPVQKTDKGQPSGKKKAIRNIHKKKGR